MDHTAPRDRRLDRRIPVACPARIRTSEGVEVPAECMDLSVRGMTLHASYVPKEGEILEVVINPPGAHAPLVSRLRIMHCHAIGDGRYEIGGSTVTVG